MMNMKEDSIEIYLGNSLINLIKNIPGSENKNYFMQNESRLLNFHLKSEGFQKESPD